MILTIKQFKGLIKEIMSEQAANDPNQDNKSALKQQLADWFAIRPDINIIFRNEFIKSMERKTEIEEADFNRDRVSDDDMNSVREFFAKKVDRIESQLQKSLQKLSEFRSKYQI